MSTHGGSLDTPLRLVPSASRWLLAWLLLGNLLAAAALASLPLERGWTLLGVCGLLGLLAWSYRLHISRTAADAIVAAVWDEHGAWRLTLASGEQSGAELLLDSFVSVGLVVLLFRPDGRYFSRSVVLPHDSLHPDLLRRLRVRLRLWRDGADQPSTDGGVRGA